VRYARAFAGRRRIEGGRVPGVRLYALESTPTPTGALADYRLPAAPAEMRAVLRRVAALLGLGGGAPVLPGPAERFASRLASDLRGRAPEVLCLAAAEEGDDIAAWAAAVNERLGARGTTLRFLPALRSDGHPLAAGDLTALGADIEAGGVQALFVLGCNPAYTAPADAGFPALLDRVPYTVHLGELNDETGAACTWHLPGCHYLEAWGDLRAYDGTASIVQPLIDPIAGGRSEVEVLALLAGNPRRGQDLVRATWAQGRTAAELDAAWHGWLAAGVIPGTASAPAAAPGAAALPELADRAGDAVTLVIHPDPTIGDGR
jgi:molybdopterin-containing oxidoreductase family iron-sulfur binding subunit